MFLLEAVWHGDLDAVREFLEKRKKKKKKRKPHFVTTTDDFGDEDEEDVVNSMMLGGLTALGVASYRGDEDMVELLLKEGAAEVNVVSLRESVITLFDEFMTKLDDLALVVQQEEQQVQEQAVVENPSNEQQQQSQQLLIMVQDVHDEQTPLHVASRRGHDLIVKRLVDHGAGVDILSEKGFSCLHLAAMNGHEAAAAILLQSQDQEGRRNGTQFAHEGTGETPLTLACKNKHVHMIRPLVQAGADINARNYQGQTPLGWALQTEHEEMVEELVQVSLQEEEDDKPESQRKRSAVVHVNEISDGEGWTALHWAVIWKNEALVERLLALKARVHASYNQGVTPLHFACEADIPLRIAQLLLQAPSDDNDSNHLAIVNAMNDQGETPLHWACYHGRLQHVQLLLEHGAHINATTIVSRETPLVYALEQQHADIARYLLLQPNAANHELYNVNHVTPLHVAIDKCPAVVTDLLRLGANVHAATRRKGTTPLHLACCSSNNNTECRRDIVGQLLDRGADMMVPNHEGKTPLHLAMENNNSNSNSSNSSCLEIIKLLVVRCVALFQEGRSSRRRGADQGTTTTTTTSLGKRTRSDA